MSPNDSEAEPLQDKATPKVTNLMAISRRPPPSVVYQIWSRMLCSALFLVD
jgi:hypothetical protein